MTVEDEIYVELKAKKGKGSGKIHGILFSYTTWCGRYIPSTSEYYERIPEGKTMCKSCVKNESRKDQYVYAA